MRTWAAFWLVAGGLVSIIVVSWWIDQQPWPGCNFGGLTQPKPPVAGYVAYCEPDSPYRMEWRSPAP